MDYQRALADGHTPEDVMGELARRGVKMDYKRALADGHDPMDVLREMNSREGKRPTPRPAPTKQTAPAATPQPTRSDKWTNPLAPLGAAIKRKWDRFKEHPVSETLHTAGQIIAEPVQLGGEAVTGIANSIAGIGRAAQASTAARRQGQSIPQQAKAAFNKLAEPTYEPALGQSWTGRAIGHVVGDVTNKAAQDLNLPGLPKAVAAGGNLLGLAGVKPTISTARMAPGVVKNRLATAGERGILPYGAKRAQFQAAQKFDELSQPLSPEQAMVQQTNVADAQLLENRINAGRAPEDQAHFTPGEQGVARHAVNDAVRRSRSKDPTHALRAELNDNALAAGARQQVDQAIPGGPGEGARTVRDRIQAEAGKLNEQAGRAGQTADTAAAPLAATDSPQTVGQRILDALTGKRSPEKAAKKAAYDAVDKLGYDMEFPNYEKRVGEIIDAAGKESEPVATAVRDILKKTLDKARSTSGYDAVYQTLNGYLRDLNGSTTLGASRISSLLQEAKSALRADADALSEAAAKGDVAIHPGEGGKSRIVRPSTMRSEIADLEKRIAEEQGKQAGADVDAMRGALMDAGDTSAMKLTGEKPADYTNRLTRQFQRKFPNQQVPSVSAVDATRVAEMTARRDTLSKQLGELQPAEDFAAKYNKATTLARQEAERYGKGAADEVFRQGNQSSGQRLSHEQVPAKFATETGADDLARALSNSTERDARGKLVITEEGRKAAGELMRDHFAEQAARMVENPKKLAAWVDSPKVKPVLQKLGLYDEFSTLSRAKQTVTQAQSKIDAFNKSTVGKIMNMDPDSIVSWIHKQPDPRAAMKEVMAFSNDPAYRAGLQVAVRDWVMNSGEVTAEDMLGFNKTSLSKSKQLQVARTKRMLREVFTPAQMDVLSDFHETIRNISRNKTTPHGSTGSNTSFLQSKDMGQVGYGVARDVSRHFGGALVNSVANIVRHYMKGITEAHAERIEQFVDQAALNPADAKMLTDLIKQSQTRKGVTEATRKMLGARLRGYASTAGVRGATGNAVTQGVTPPTPQQWGEPDDVESDIEFRAYGGPVAPGKQYVTGEQRPELLINSDGTRQILGVQGPQIIAPSQPGVVVPTADMDDVTLNGYLKQQGWNPATSDMYDYRGYIQKHGSLPEQGKGHLNDEFKLPSHITFSTDSKYSSPQTMGGRWEKKDGKWHYTPSKYVIDKQGVQKLREYFKNYEPDAVLVLP